MSKTRDKGRRFENEVVDYLVENGFEYAVRNELNSPVGDIGNVPVVLECKNHKTMTLAEWCDQAQRSSEKANKPWFVVHKRIRKNIKQAYVTTDLEQFAKMLAIYEWFINL
jgi:Holliday junction resolvase